VVYRRLEPAPLAFAADGTPYSAEFDDIYHSVDGGLEQARHVFLGGNNLPAAWQGRERFVVVETGFGLGLNFLATWQAWRDDPQRCGQLHFVSVEQRPFRRDDLAQLHRRWPELARFATELAAAWPPLTPGFHRLAFEGGRVVLHLLLGPAEELIPTWQGCYDALYLDGFAPAKNPAMWTPRLLNALSRHASPTATLATWSVAPPVREALAAAGWLLEKQPGFGRKFAMLVGHRRPMAPGQRRSGLYSHLEPAACTTPANRRALVIGAGLAGCAIAERLAVRGWQIDLIERHDQPAQEASGNRAGLLHPMLSRDDNLASRLSRACHLFSLRLLQQVDSENRGLLWGHSGILQLARDAAQEQEQKEAWEALGFPNDYLEFLDRTAVKQKLGQPVAAGGWFWPGGAWVSPPTLSRALLTRGGERIQARFNTTVARLERTDDGWRALAADGSLIAQAPVAILANAHDAASLAPDFLPPLNRIRGQVSLLPAGSIPAIDIALCGNGYLTPNAGGVHALGATYDFNDDDPTPRLAGHLTNLEHLAGLLPGLDISALNPAQLQGRIGFRTATIDRLPLAGAVAASPATPPRSPRLSALSRVPGLYALLGLGSRGILWGPLAAEMLAAQLEGEPLPLPADLVAAIDPARFILRDLKRGAVSNL